MIKKYFTLSHLLLVLCLALFAVLSLRKSLDYDIGFHLKGGEWIVQNLSVPRTDTFTFTCEGRPYLDIHWLYQASMYGLQRLGGYEALSLFNAFLFLMLFFLLLKRMSLLFPWSGGWPFFLVLIGLGVEHRFLLRPEILSWVFLTAVLLIMDWYDLRRKNVLWALPLIHLVWANVHGLFILGWLVLGAYVLGHWLRDRQAAKLLLKWSLASVLATAVNPYFLKGALYPFLTQVSLGDNLFKKTIGELLSPLSAITKGMYPGWPMFLAVYLAVFALTLAAAVVFARKLKAHEWTLLVTFGFLSAVAVRNIPLFLLVAVPILARLLSDIKFNSRWVTLAQMCLALFLAVTALRVVHHSYYLSNADPAEFGLGIKESHLPVKAAGFLLSNRLEDRMIHSDGFGGWLEWSGLKAFLDGRLEVVGESLYSEYVSAMRPGGSLAALADKYEAPVVVWDNHSMPIQGLQKLREKGWRMVYLDENAAVFLKPGYRKDLPDFDFTSLLPRFGLKPIDPTEAEALVQKPAASWLGAFAKGMIRIQEDPAKYFYLAEFSYQYAQYEISERFLLEGLRATEGRGYSFFKALGRAYLAMRQWKPARACFEKALRFGKDRAELERVLSLMPAQ